MVRFSLGSMGRISMNMDTKRTEGMLHFSLSLFLILRGSCPRVYGVTCHRIVLFSGMWFSFCFFFSPYSFSLLWGVVFCLLFLQGFPSVGRAVFSGRGPGEKHHHYSYINNLSTPPYIYVYALFFVYKGSGSEKIPLTDFTPYTPPSPQVTNT